METLAARGAASVQRAVKAVKIAAPGSFPLMSALTYLILEIIAIAIATLVLIVLRVVVVHPKGRNAWLCVSIFQLPHQGIGLSDGRGAARLCRASAPHVCGCVFRVALVTADRGGSGTAHPDHSRRLAGFP